MKSFFFHFLLFTSKAVYALLHLVALKNNAYFDILLSFQLSQKNVSVKMNYCCFFPCKLILFSSKLNN